MFGNWKLMVAHYLRYKEPLRVLVTFCLRCGKREKVNFINPIRLWLRSLRTIEGVFSPGFPGCRQTCGPYSPAEAGSGGRARQCRRPLWRGRVGIGREVWSIAACHTMRYSVLDIWQKIDWGEYWVGNILWQSALWGRVLVCSWGRTIPPSLESCLWGGRNCWRIIRKWESMSL